ncbi:MAG: hypothetical protein ABSF22_11990 [Bryobacteraceae bacterium]|jgi:hypothetical protein
MKKILLLASGLIAASFIASADPLCSNGFTLVNNQPSTDSSVYVIDGTNTFGAGLNGCTIGAYDFSNFTIAANTGYNGSTLLNVGINAVGNTLEISTNLSIAAGQDIELEFSITPGVTGITLAAGGGASVNEIVCSTAEPIGSGLVGSCGGVTLGTGAVGGLISQDTFPVLTSPTGTDWVFKDISGASEISQLILPEPMTFSLMGAGLLGLGIFGRRRSSK